MRRKREQPSDAEHAMEVLRESEARYRHLVENATDIIYTQDLDGHLISVNAAGEKLFGYSRGEVIGRSIADLVAPEDRERARAMTAEKLAHGGSTTYTVTVLTRSGTRVPLEVSTQLIYERGVAVAVQGIARDVTERQRVATALERSERYFRTLTENSADGITILEADGRVRYSSPAGERIMGYAPNERLGQPILDIVHPDDVATGRALLERVWKEPNATLSAVLRARHRDGSWRHIRFHLRNLLRDPDVHGVVLNWHDITDQITADERLTAREHFFRSIIEHSTDILMVLDEDFNISYASPAFEAIMGYRPEAVIGSSGSQFMDEAGAATLAEMTTALRDRHEPTASGVIRARDRDGVVHVFDVRSRNLLNDPLIHGVVVDGRDITESTHFQEALRQSEQRFRKIVETSGEGIGIRDIAGKLVFANERFAEMLGYRLDEVIGLNVFDVVVPEHRQLMADSAERRKQTGKSEQLDIAFLRKDGSRVFVILSASPLFDTNGEYIGALGMLTDITERKHLEEQLRQAQKIEAVGRLAGGVAHDFNNLLTAIRGHVELLLTEVGPESPLFLDIEEIRRASDRAASLTQQLLAFSRRQILQPRVIEIDQIVADMNTLLRRLIGEDVQLVTHLHAGQARVRADQGQIEQVLMNLIVNARDAMPNGGSVAITTSLIDVSEEFVRANAGAHSGWHVRLLISDTGTGMDPDTLSHVFEPFFTTKERGKGTGLGLATVYGIIKQSGGFIRVESDLATGTSFEILLPAVQELPEAAHDAVNDTDVHVRNETVLVAEDEDAVRALATRVLRKRGYHVLEARHGVEALEIAEQHTGHIHLLVSDVVMPMLGGRELAEKLRLVRPNVKILFMSGYTDDALIQHGVSQGADSFLEKPFTPETLVRRVQEVLESD